MHARLLESITRLIERITGTYEYDAPVRYRVVSQASDKLKLQAVRKGPWPDATNVQMTPGAAGYNAQLTVGSIVLITFVEGDPSLPTVTHFAGPGSDGFVPVSIEIGGTGRPVARVGDTVAAYFPPAMPVVGTVSGNPFVGTITITTPSYGLIQTGSSIVAAGPV